MEFKQCIVIREDLKLSAGKLAVQVAHAAVMAVERAEKMDRSAVSEWKAEGQKKVVLKVPGVSDLFRLREDAERAGIPSAIVGRERHRSAGSSQRYFMAELPLAVEVFLCVTRRSGLLHDG